MTEACTLKNFLSESDDIEVLLRGVRIARKVLHASAFDPCRSVELLPGPGADSDEALREHIRNTAVTVHHPVSTCRMGTDDNCVVDPELRVRGVPGLRVVDASVFPALISGNINAAVVMIAEKAADIMRGRAPAAPIDP